MSELLSLHAQASRLLDVGRHAEARRLLGQALQQAPDDPESLFLAARVEFESERHADARDFVGRTLEVDPDHYGARLLLFQILFAAKEHARAEEVILGLLREYPEEAPLYALYANLMLETLHLAKARGLVDEALRLDPEDGVARPLDCILRVVEGDDREAERRLGPLIASDPEARHVVATCITVFSSRGRHREALALARQLLRASPGDADVVDLLVELRLQTHWTMLPLRPFQRWGWAGSGVMWVVGVGGGALLSRAVSRRAGSLFLMAYGVYVLYSWVWPPLLRRWLRWRGF